MDVTMGLLAALLWGGTDFLVGLNARAVGVKRAVYFGQAVGFVIMTLLLVIFPALLFKSLNASLSVWLLGIAAALFTVSGALALSKAFALGKAAIVAPLVTSYGVVTTLLSWGSGVGGASAGGCAGAGRGGGLAYRRLTFHAQKSRPQGAAF